MKSNFFHYSYISIVKVLALSFCLLFGSVSIAQGREITVSCPLDVEIGVPFLLSITVLEGPVSGEVVWCDQIIPFELLPSSSEQRKDFLLGTNVRTAYPGKATLIVKIVAEGEQKHLEFPLIIKAKIYPEEHLTLPNHMVTPPEAALQRIAKERVETRKVLLHINKESHWELPLFKPVDGAVTSVYGKRRVLNGRPSSPHAGVDFRAAQGTKIKAALGGEVVLVADHYFSGRTVFIDSGSGVISIYGHLSRPYVKNGDFIKKGDVIGESGQTGRITGPHLHFSLSLQGQLVDPAPLFLLDQEPIVSRNQKYFLE